MSVKTIIRTAAVSTLASMLCVGILTVASSAEAQAAPEVLNQQIELGDVFSNMQVILPGAVDGDAHASGLAYGNVLSVEAPTGFSASSTQTMQGTAEAQSLTTGGQAAGQASAYSVTYGNSVVLDGENGLVRGAPLLQTTTSGADMRSTATVNNTAASAVSATANAVANIMEAQVDTGNLEATVDQLSESNARAESVVDNCCDGLSTQAAATAMGNSYASTTTTANSVQAVNQTNSGVASTAITRVAHDNGVDIAAASTSTGNNILIDSEWGYAQLDGAQTNAASLSAETHVTLNDWSGMGYASSYGVGNSAYMSNAGSDAKAYYSQSNTGDVYATTELDAATTRGGVASVSATAVGNAFTDAVCNMCGPASASGSITQTNAANIRSSARVTAAGASGVSGVAASIGNSASFTTFQPN